MTYHAEELAIATLKNALKDPLARIPSRYRADYFAHQKQLNLKSLLKINLFAQLAYFSYAFVDCFILNDVGSLIIYNKLAYTLCMTVFTLLIYRTKNVLWFDIFLPYSVAGATALWFYHLNLSDAAYSLSYQYTSSVFIVLASLAVQFRFLAALFPNLLIVLVTMIGVYYNTHLDWTEFGLFAVSYIPIVLFSIYIGWNIAHKSRVAFLQQMLTDLHYKSSERLANTDVLTGLSNRRAFEKIAAHYMEQNGVDYKKMSLIVFDVDNFKKINDTYGHDIGDQVLQQIADISTTLIRAKDVLARIGGEEFTLLLPNTRLEKAHSIAERLRTTLEQSGLTLANGEYLTFTVSLGVAAIHPEYKEIRQAFNQADEALYRAKKEGRNRTCVELTH